MKHAGIIAAGWGERLGQKIPKALTPVGPRHLIDFVIDGLEAAGVTHVTCIVNEAAREVPVYVASLKRKLEWDWIVQTTPSSMHSFLIVLNRLAEKGPGPFLMATVDGVAAPETYRLFAERCALLPAGDVLLGLTDVIEDEKPLRVAMVGKAGTGMLPVHFEDNPEAFEISAMTTTGFGSEWITSGFYQVKPSILGAQEKALQMGYSALRQYLGYLLKYGYQFYGVPLPPVIDVDRPEDVASAERFLKINK